MPKPEKKERNKEILKRRQQGWTFGELASFYGIKRPTVFKIVKRYEEKVSVSNT